MRLTTLALGLLLVGPAGRAVHGAHVSTSVSIRATTAAISVTGGDAEVTAALYDEGGVRIDGLVVERAMGRTTIVLVVAVKVGARIEARVPSSTDLRIEASNGGPVMVHGVSGQLEIVNSNAGIVLDRVGGTVLASTSNGSIEAAVRTVDPALPMSFLTSNGRIDLTFPANLKANLRMESDTGPITTDFELARIDDEPVERRIMRGGRLRTIVYGAVNGGGPEIGVRTENAPIVVRRQR
jgi:hypothetical protein